MSNLIKNELIKVVKKKSLYIILIVTLIFIIISNILYKYTSSFEHDGYYSEEYISILSEQIKTLNPENPDEIDGYIQAKDDIDLYNLLKQYDTKSWQYTIVLDKGMKYISEINYFTYRNKDNEGLQIAKEEYDNFINLLNQGNWRKFAEADLKIAKENKEIGEIPEADIEIEILQKRLDYNIEYGDNYKNNALSLYKQSKIQINQYKENENKLTHYEKIEYQNAKENLEKSKYVIENDKDILNTINARGILINSFTEYELFIIIAIVIIAGVIVSEEFNKGTIKLLLVRPFKRWKILMSKYIVSLFVIIFMIIFIIIMQLIVGSIVFGTDSFKNPVIEYNHNTNTLEEINILQTIILTAFGKLPIYIAIGTLAFALSTIFTNSAVAITISLLGYMASSIINEFAYHLNIKWLKFFITPNWDLSQYLYGKLPNMEGINLAFSAIICLIYFAIMLIPTFIAFSKKNIKNI